MLIEILRRCLPEYEKSPFVILPAVFRMQPAGIQSLRVFYNGAALPSNKESVVWLNLYEIPGVKKKGLTRMPNLILR